MDSDIDLKSWAKELGFEGADDPQFSESWKKLVCPSMRNIWRHITSHVLPAQKADYIRKHCLLYKLEVEEKYNKEVKLQANVKSLKEYEKLKKIENAQVELAYLDKQIASVCSEIQELNLKLNNDGLKHKEDQENEKWSKCKLLKNKIKLTNKTIDDLKEMSTICDDYIQTRPNVTFMENDSKWDKEVVEFCKALPERREILTLTEYLGSVIPATEKTVSNDKKDKENKVLQEIELMLCNKYYESRVHRSNFEAKMKQIDLLKLEIIQKFEEHYKVENQVEKLNMIFDLNIKDIFDTVEGNALINLQNSWSSRNTCKTEQYVNLKSNISFLEREMEKKRNTIALSLFGQKKLISACTNAQIKIIEEQTPVISDDYKLLIEKVHDLNFLAKEIELFLKVKVLRKNNINDSGIGNSISIKKLDKYDELVNKLNLELPQVNTNAAKNILDIEVLEMNLKMKLKPLVASITKTVSDIRKLKSGIAYNLEFCKTQPLAEGLRSSPEEYRSLRARYKEALNNLRVAIEEEED